MKHLLKLLFLGVLLCSAIGLTLTACGETEDCSLSGRPSPRFNFIVKSTLKTKSLDSLTVVALNTVKGDSIILNNSKKVTYASLPLSYVDTKTAMVFKYSESLSDTLWITHANIAHFLSMECGITMFYQVEKVEHTSNLIDSIAIINSGVETNEKENIRVYY